MARTRSKGRARKGRSEGLLAILGEALLGPPASRKGGGRSRGKAAEGGPGGDRLREVLSLLLLGVTLFLTLACLSAGDGDNLCGPAGEALAAGLLGTFGYAAWLLVGCLGLWGAALFLRIGTPRFSLRTAGLLLCLVSTAALLAHLFGDVSGRWPAGGVVGEYINGQLIEVGGLGVVGTRIVLIVLTLVTFALATDVVYYAAVMAGARWVAAQGAALAEAGEKVLTRPRPEPRAAGKRRGAAAVTPDEDEEEIEDEDEVEAEPDTEEAAEEGAATAASGRRRAPVVVQAAHEEPADPDEDEDEEDEEEYEEDDEEPEDDEEEWEEEEDDWEDDELEEDEDEDEDEEWEDELDELRAPTT